MRGAVEREHDEVARAFEHRQLRFGRRPGGPGEHRHVTHDVVVGAADRQRPERAEAVRDLRRRRERQVAVLAAEVTGDERLAERAERVARLGRVARRRARRSPGRTTAAASARPPSRACRSPRSTSRTIAAESGTNASTVSSAAWSVSASGAPERMSSSTLVSPAPARSCSLRSLMSRKLATIPPIEGSSSWLVNVASSQCQLPSTCWARSSRCTRRTRMQPQLDEGLGDRRRCRRDGGGATRRARRCRRARGRGSP